MRAKQKSIYSAPVSVTGMPTMCKGAPRFASCSYKHTTQSRCHVTIALVKLLARGASPAVQFSKKKLLARNPNFWNYLYSGLQLGVL